MIIRRFTLTAMIGIFIFQYLSDCNMIAQYTPIQFNVAISKKANQRHKNTLTALNSNKYTTRIIS